MSQKRYVQANKKMEIKFKYGIGVLVFGMRQEEVLETIGEPDEIRQDNDTDSKFYFLYNDLQLRLTFYNNEKGKLGYIESSNPSIHIAGNLVINKKIEEVKNDIIKSRVTKWEKSEYHSFTTYYDEVNWLTFVVEYNKVISVELGVTFRDDENYLWPLEIND